MSASDDAASGEAAHHDDAPADEGAPAHDAHGH
jgi:hypothetical protein